MKKKTLVLGASTKEERYSNKAINRLINSTHDVVAIGAKRGKVAGVEIDITEVFYDGIDTITLYLNPLKQKDYYEYILGLKPKRVIFNPGTENPELYEILKRANIEIEVACTLVLLSTDQY